MFRYLVCVLITSGSAFLLSKDRFGDIGGAIALMLIAVTAWFCGPGPGLISPFVLIVAGSLMHQSAVPPATGFRLLDVINLGILTLLFWGIGWAGALRRKALADLREREQRLAESEARYRAIGESIDFGVWVCDSEGRNTYASESFLRMVGITQQQCSDFGWGDVLHPDDAAATIAAWKECVRTHGNWDREHRFRGVDGQWYDVLARGVPLRGAVGESLGWAGINLDITRLVRTEREIARLAAESDRQRRLYETVLTNTPDFVYVFSLDHRVLYANDALIKMWGRGREGAIGKTFLEIGYEPWHAEMHCREIDQVRATRQPIRGEASFTGTNGGRQYEYIFVPVIGDDGEVEAVAGTTRDVTDRQAAEADRERLLHQAEEQRELLDNVFRQAPAFMCVLRGVDHVFQMANDRYFALVGQRDILRKSVREALPEVVEQGFIDLLDAVYKTGEPFIGTGVRISLDQTGARYVDFVYQALRDPDHRVTGVMVVGVDVTARHKAEEELRQSEERFRTLFNSMDEGFCVIEMEFDPAGRASDYRIQVMNSAFEKHTGMNGLTGKSIRQAIPGLEEFWYEQYGLVATTGEPTRFVHEAGSMGGRWFDVSAFRLGGGGSKKVAVLFNDITVRRQAEETLRVSEARQTFLVKLADTLRPLSDPVDVQAEASRVLGEHLGANRVVYFEICGDEYVIERDYTAGIQPLVGRYPVAAFGPALLDDLLNGRTVIEADATTEPDRLPSEKAAFASIQVRGHVDVPLVKNGRFVAGMTVHFSDRRDWTRQDVALIEETAERTWAAVERVRAEAALRVSEEGRRLALDAAELGTFNIDPTTNALTTDERFRIIFAGTTEATGYEQAFAAIHPDDRERIREAVAAATRIDDPTAYAEEYRVIHRDGSVRWVFAKGRANFVGEGPGRRLVSFDGTISDITARKEAEMQVQESEQRFRLVADAAPVMIWMSGTDKLVSWYNKPWLEFTGRSMEEEVGNGATEVVHPEDLGRTLPLHLEAFEARAPFSMEYRLRRHDGEFRWMICNGVPRYRADGEFEGYIGSCLDITDYKNAVTALRDADRRKDEFLATLAHELRNPLAPIRNGLEVIRMSGVDGTVEQARLMMERQLGQMVRLVDDLLDVSRVTTGKLQLRTERVELRAVIDAALETTRPVIEQAGHDLTVVVPDEPIFVEGDTTRLAQVVSNLLNNSAKYTHPGGRIVLEVRREGATAVISVKDNGIGIPPAMLDKVFVMFTQVDRTLEKTTGGLGIGLSLVRGLVEMHGGTIEACSEGEGRGSEFIVRLPIQLSAVRNVVPRVVNEPATSSSSRRILVADDNVDSAESLGRLLKLLGNDVSTAHDGSQAVAVAETFRPEVILLDIGMPKLNGFEAARRIRAQAWGQDVVLIALTGWGKDDDRQKTSEAGFDHHLVKPVEVAVLTNLLSEVHRKTN